MHAALNKTWQTDRLTDMEIFQNDLNTKWLYRRTNQFAEFLKQTKCNMTPRSVRQTDRPISMLTNKHTSAFHTPIFNKPTNEP